jgi:hypothetical protein
MLALRMERCGNCLALFMICRPCYRGQTYCGAACRERVRTLQSRAARARHQESPLGRADHRDRNRQCRLRKRSAAMTSVMDQGSKNVAHPGNVRMPENPPASIPDAHEVDGRSSHESATPQNYLYSSSTTAFRCTVCARIGVVHSEWPQRSARLRRRAARWSRAGPM